MLRSYFYSPACELIFSANLFGHQEAITCLAVSHAFKVVLSASEDRTCILWDLNKLECLRRLRGLNGAARFVDINDSTVSYRPLIIFY